MECANCLRTSDEGYNISSCGGGLFLCDDCRLIHDEINQTIGIMDPALYEMSVWSPEVGDE